MGDEWTPALLPSLLNGPDPTTGQILHVRYNWRVAKMGWQQEGNMSEEPKPADRPMMNPLEQLKLEFGDKVRTVTEKDGSEKPIFMMTPEQESIRRRWVQLTAQDE